MSGTSFFGGPFFGGDFCAYVAPPEIPVAPQPAHSVFTSYGQSPVWEPAGWRGMVFFLSAYESGDQFGTLSANQDAPKFAQSAALAAFAENDEYAELSTCAESRGRLRALPPADEFGAFTACRGLPSQALLDWWMREAA